MLASLIRTIAVAVLGSVAVVSHAAVYDVTFSSRLYRSDLVPPFGDYTTDVLIEKWATVSGTLRLERNAFSDPALALGESKLHLENFLYRNGVDVSSEVQLYEGWPVTPTDWTVNWDQSYVGLDAAEAPFFQLVAYRGDNMFSINRPFHVGGNVGGYHDLQWITVRQDEATWHTTPGIDRSAPVAFTVRAVPELGSSLLMGLGLLLFWATWQRGCALQTYRGKKSTRRFAAQASSLVQPKETGRSLP